MTDIAVSVFSLTNARGWSAPKLNIHYEEQGSGIEWVLSCGGTRAYTVRHGASLDNNLESQAADSHFMMRRLTAGLLLGAEGLFEAKPVGRLLFRGIEGRVEWDSELDFWQVPEERDLPAVGSWLGAVVNHIPIRRAAEDLQWALGHPLEAMVFLYRGFEWIVRGVPLSWKGLAAEIGIPYSELRKLKRFANVETGIRHASSSGIRVRADLDTYGTWACGLVEAINVARARLEPGFPKMSPTETARVVAQAVQMMPYS